jgi:hypothetical protein
MFAENTHKSNDIIGISIFENKESDNILQYIRSSWSFQSALAGEHNSPPLFVSVGHQGFGH